MSTNLKSTNSKAQSLSTCIITSSRRAVNERRLDIMEVYGVVYLLIDGTNDMEYVGQTTRSVEERFKEHAKADSYIGNAIRDHGEDMFVIVILKVCYSKKEMDSCERHMICSRDTKFPNGYNMTDGGESGWAHLPETRAKMAKSHTGTHLSKETKAKIAVTHMGEKNPNFGKSPSPEQRAKLGAKMSLINKGVSKSPEHCVHLSESKRGDSPYKNLVTAITKRKFTYRNLAKILGIGHQSISRKMSGKRSFMETEWAKLAELFNLPAEYLMVRDDDLPSLPKPRTGENNSFFGRHHTEKTLAILSEKNSGANHPNFGKHQTKEAKAKIGAGNRGKKRTAEARAKVSVKKRTESPFKNLAEVITERKFTYGALAELLGVTQSVFSRKMTGVRKFMEKDWAKLSEILNLPVEYLMAREDA